jgi:hypothetical protein
MLRRLLRSMSVVSVLVVSLSGCMTMGPRSIGPDRLDYIQEIGESWKKQMLLNIVKLRYLDPPTFLDVSSIINQYGIENQINADAKWYWPTTSIVNNSAGLGGYSRYSDKPTITYTPLSGQKFTQNLLTPIPPSAVVRLIQSGWPIDMVFSFAVKTVNGVSNNATGIGWQDGEKDFQRLVQALRKVQLGGLTDLRLEKINDKETVVFVISDNANKEAFREESQTIRKILKVKPDVSSYKIVFGSLPQNNDEMALLTRSVLEIMLEMGSVMEIPRKHLEEKWVKEKPSIPDEEALAHIYSGRDKPAQSYVAIRYQDYWFWIENKDIQSKRNFALLMIFMSLTETEQKSGAPLLTIGQ